MGRVASSHGGSGTGVVGRGGGVLSPSPPFRGGKGGQMEMTSAGIADDAENPSASSGQAPTPIPSFGGGLRSVIMRRGSLRVHKITGREGSLEEGGVVV